MRKVACFHSGRSHLCLAADFEEKWLSRAKAHGRKVLLTFLFMLVWGIPAESYAQESIFANLKSTIELQEHNINVGGYVRFDDFERLPYLCLRAFVDALKPGWDDAAKTLVFQTSASLASDSLFNKDLEVELRNEKFQEKDCRYVFYPMYRCADWDKLLSNSNLLIRYKLSFTKIAVAVYIHAAYKAPESSKITKIVMFYDFRLAYVFRGSEQRIEENRQKLIKNICNEEIRLFDENGFIFPDMQEISMTWKLKRIWCDDVEEMEYKPSGNDSESILNYNF